MVTIVLQFLGDMLYGSLRPRVRDRCEKCVLLVKAWRRATTNTVPRHTHQVSATANAQVHVSDATTPSATLSANPHVMTHYTTNIK